MADEPKSTSRTPKDLAEELGLEIEDHDLPPDDLDLADIDDALASYVAEMKPRGGATASLIALIAFLCIVSGVAVVWASPKWRGEMQCFFEGRIRECKMAAIYALEAKWKEQDFLQKNKYGQIEIFYSPRDSKVEIQVQKFLETEDAFMDRLKKHVDARTTPAVICAIDNDSLHLAEGQEVKKISLPDLPIQEKMDTPEEAQKFISGCICQSDAQCPSGTVCRAAKPTNATKVCMASGEVAEGPEATDIRMASYRYLISITHEGYKPRAFLLSEDAVANPGDGVQLMTWEKIGPEKYIINFPGADLVPEPETAKENVKKVLIDSKCELQKEKDPEARAALEEQIRIRHNFKSVADWQSIVEQLKTTDPTWWEETQKDLKKIRCD